MAAGGHFEKFQTAISQQGAIRSTSCLVLRVSGSNGAISGWIKSKMATGGHFEHFQTAISQQGVILSISYLVLGWFASMTTKLPPGRHRRSGVDRRPAELVRDGDLAVAGRRIDADQRD